MQWLLKKMLGTKRERDIKKLQPLVDRINEIEVECQSLSEDQLKAKTQEFRDRLEKDESIDDMMCEAFGVVKNVCRRICGTTSDVCGHDMVWKEVPWDSQLIAAIVLHQGKIAELATGEGKTLAATMPLYLNALTGKNVQLVTVNDYLARRDAQWMGAVYDYLGLRVGCIQNQMSPSERREQYACDITYGTNSEFGFDYLRDNGMAYTPESQVQRDYYYVIIDEVDSILIDEARTPLIISGPAPSSSHQYFELKPRVDRLVKQQRELCNGLAKEAKEHLEKGDDARAQLRLYQVSHGMPKHRQLMRLLEEPAVRKLHEQIEGQMLTDMRKEQGRELREELFFTIDERGHDASLTEKGCEALNPSDPDAYVLPDLTSAMADLDGETELSEPDKMNRLQKIQESFTEKSEVIHNVDQLIRAYCLYEKDVQYVVQGNQVLIVDENTGRMMPGRRWSDGLHQAVEAKEGVKIERETQTLATITIQNYFRMYSKLAGMTGTAETEADEFNDIYKLDVAVIPTNRPVRRLDGNDVIYKSQREKYAAIIEAISECHHKGQPVLVGTISVNTSELISRMLKRANIPHSVLNAKNHEGEADIVMRAGQPGAVTIATNMAGRGTDIKLGEGVVQIGRDIVESDIKLSDKVEGKTLRSILEERPSGLYVMGTERHESRRIDRQLRGRCARQGDPGASQFFISLEDDLMRLFGSDRIAGIMERLGLQEGQMLEHRWLNRSIETAQRRVEQHNFSIRKRTLQYDDVMNKQREIIYGFRGEIVRSENVGQHICDIIEDVVSDNAQQSVTGQPEGVAAFVDWVRTSFPVPIRVEDLAEIKDDPEACAEHVFRKVKAAYDLKVRSESEDEDAVRSLERSIILQAIDSHWQDYLRGMDSLREGVGLRAYGQRDPLVEYKREAFDMFETLMDTIKQDVTHAAFRSATSAESFERFMDALPQMLKHDDVSVLGKGTAGPTRAGRGALSGPLGLDGIDGPSPESRAGGPQPFRRESPKVGRNDPCPCGSGKKYKKCCGAK